MNRLSEMGHRPAGFIAAYTAVCAFLKLWWPEGNVEELGPGSIAAALPPSFLFGTTTSATRWKGQ
jgi:hypothetical protein